MLGVFLVSRVFCLVGLGFCCVLACLFLFCFFFPSVWVVVLIFALQGGSGMACMLQSLIVQDCKKILLFLKTEV